MLCGICSELLDKFASSEVPIKEDPKEESTKKADTDFVSKDGDAEYLAKFDQQDLEDLITQADTKTKLNPIEFKSVLLTYKRLPLAMQASMPVAVVHQETMEERQMDLEDLVAQVEEEMNPNPVVKKDARVENPAYPGEHH